MAPMAQQVQYRRARQPERSGVAQRMDIDATLRREPRVEHHADAAGRRIDRGERGHRSRRDAEQALNVLGLAEADALADRKSTRLNSSHTCASRMTYSS